MNQRFEEAAEQYADSQEIRGSSFHQGLRRGYLAGCEYAAPKWIDVEKELPDSKRDVLCIHDNGYKKIQCIGSYTKGHEIEYYDDDYQGEYDEIEDKAGCLFLKPGWYECEETPGGEFDEVWVKRNVTHWQPLPELPSPTIEETKEK